MTQIYLVYATETGNAQDLAVLAGRELRRRGIKASVHSFAAFGLDRLIKLPPTAVVLVVCSTQGQGDVPRDIVPVWRQMLRRKLPPTLLTHMRFSSFGLGDSSYTRYNWAVRKVHRRLMDLGAKEYVVRAEGDDQDSEELEAVFGVWLQSVVAKIRAETDLVESSTDETTTPEPEHTVAFSDTSLELKPEWALTRNTLVAKVAANTRMTPIDHFQDVRHLRLHHDAPLSYAPGDTVALYSSNDPDDVDALIRHQHWDEVADLQITVSDEYAATVPGGLVEHRTLRSLLTFHLDIMSIPRRSFFDLVWRFASDEREREKLKDFSGTEYLQELYDYADRPRRSIVECITEFGSLRIPVDYALDAIPLLRPRQFSIASLPDHSNGTSLELAIAIVKYRTIIRRIRQGVCTRWVSGLSEGDYIPFTIHAGTIPKTKATSQLLIATGTGIAPIRTMIQSNSCPQRLYFGCRHQEKDYLFGSEWSTYPQLHVVTAFSRMGQGYVQTKIMEDKVEVGKMIADGATVYLCGSAGTMPKQVRTALVAVIESELGLDNEAAEAYFADMQQRGKYVEEAW